MILNKISYKKLEGTYKDHPVQLLATHSTTQNSNRGTSAAFHASSPPDPSSSLLPPFGHTLIVLFRFYAVSPSSAPRAGGEAAQHRAEWDKSSPQLVAVLGMAHTRMQLVLWAARAHCWLIFSLSST